MNSYVSLCSSLREHSRKQSYAARWSLQTIAVLSALVLGGMTISIAAVGAERHDSVSGAGKTIIEGGTGGAAPMPVTTLVAFHADASGGDFECLAFAPSKLTGRESGEFDTNVMYVTGRVTSSVIGDEEATLRGIATVTGLGAGQDVPFTVRVRTGGPGATVKLKVAGLTFAEILVEGHISINHEREE
jgi:hypothetical protein